MVFKRFFQALIEKKVTLLFVVLSCILVYSFFESNKRIVVSIDNEEIEYYTSEYSIHGLLDNLEDEYELNKYNVEYSKDRIVNNAVILINTVKNINMKMGDKEFVLTTFEVDPSKILNELGDDYDSSNEYIIVYDHDKIVDDSNMQIITVKKDVIEQERVEELPVVEVETDDLYFGTRQLDSSVVSGPNVYNQKFEVVYHDGVEVERKLIDETLVSQGNSVVYLVGTKKVPNNFATGDTIWDQLAACESGGNWAINTGNGYYGGLQFNPRTWTKAAGAVGVTAPYAHLATREEQIKAAEWILSQSSWKQQWPSCSKKLGLW